MTTTPAVIEQLDCRQLLSGASGGLALVGSETPVNTFTQNNQMLPSSAMDSHGNYVIAWQSQGEDGSGYGIYAQRYNAAGAVQGGEFRVNTNTTGDQNNPAIAMNASGDFIVTWTRDDASGVYAQRYDSSGTPQGTEFRVDTEASGQQVISKVAIDPAGDFVVTWYSNYQTGTSFSVDARIFNPSGVAQGSEFLVIAGVQGDTGAKNQIDPNVAMDSSGNFVVTWLHTEPDSTQMVEAQRYTAAGALIGTPEMITNLESTLAIDTPGIAMDPNGDYVITWLDSAFSTDGSFGVAAQRFNSGGTAQGNPFKVNTHLTEDSVSATAPEVSMDAAGDFIVTWTSYGQDGSNYGVYAQAFNALGVPQGGEMKVNTYTTNSQIAPTVAMDATGDAVVAWASYSQDGSLFGVYAQQFKLSASENPLVTAPTTASVNENSSVTFSAGNNNAITVQDVKAVNTSDTVSLTATNGKLALGSTTGVTLVSGTNNSASMTLWGTLANLNSAISGLTYTPTMGYSGSASLSITANNGRDGLSGSASVAISVTVPPPSVTAPASVNVNENTSLTFSTGNSNAISVQDTMAVGNSDTVALTVTHGKLALASTAGIAFTSGSNNSASMTLWGTLPNINAALNGLTFTPTTGYTGGSLLTLTAKNGRDHLTGSHNVLISVNVPNPTVTAPTTANVNENATLTFSTGNGNAISVQDMAAVGSSDTVELSVSHGKLALGSTTGVTFVSGANNSTMMTIWGTLANLNAALSGMTYSPSSGYSGSDLLGIYVHNGRDGLATSASIAISVNVPPPTVTAPATASVNENASLTFSTGNNNAISVADIAAVATSDTITLTVTHGALLLGSTTGITFVSGANNSASMKIWGTLANLNAALSGLKYTPSAGYSGSDTLTVTAKNGRDNLSGSANVSITVNAL